jgi:hypothetical protein
MKILKIIHLILFVGMMASTNAFGQSPEKFFRQLRKQQYELSHEHYQKTWYKKETKHLREAKRLNRAAGESKKSNRRKAKLARLRSQIAQVTFWKEETHV